MRTGDPRAADAYAARGRLQTTHPALVAERVARQHQAAATRGATVAITTASAARARDINAAIQRRQGSSQRGRSVRLGDGTQVWAGDRIATRRNHASLAASTGAAVRNRQSWTVSAVGRDGALKVSDRDRGSVVLPADYVASHVELGWAVTDYGNQGVTADVGVCVVERTTSRAGLYVGLTRGRRRNMAWVIDADGTEDPAETIASIIGRPAGAETAHAVRDRLHGYEVVDVPPEVRQARQRLAAFEGRTARRGLSRPSGATIR
jgi:ATP-dependent exoDNAse (exonuclease V) alpha subunit